MYNLITENEREVNTMTDRMTVKELREMLKNFADGDTVRLHVMGNVADAWLTIGDSEDEILTASDE